MGGVAVGFCDAVVEALVVGVAEGFGVAEAAVEGPIMGLVVAGGATATGAVLLAVPTLNAAVIDAGPSPAQEPAVSTPRARVEARVEVRTIRMRANSADEGYCSHETPMISRINKPDALGVDESSYSAELGSSSAQGARMWPCLVQDHPMSGYAT
jgi:hypothetical protein